MRTREQVDAELHVLKSVIRGCTDGRERGEMETARFNLFAAFEQRDEDSARRWARAMRAALYVAKDERLRAIGTEALDAIEEACASAQRAGRNHT